jgi:hypothetical protein
MKSATQYSTYLASSTANNTPLCSGAALQREIKNEYDELQKRCMGKDGV